MKPIPASAFRRELEALNKTYDEKEHMLIAPFSSPGYHTTLKDGTVHRTVSAFSYAVALLDSGEEEYLRRAVQVLKKIIPLQDTDPESKTYGIWSWFLEEPLEKMSPPDWNWADFCGKQLVQVALDHFPRLTPEVRELVKSSVIHACHSIIRRNMGPHYTNISLMGTYVTHVAGELFGQEEILSYAKKRLENLHAYNMQNGEFAEYNSPTYTVVAIEEISRMLLHIKDPGSLKMAGDLNEMAWGCLARHFHLPTRQWAGPHSRCYANLLPKKVLSLIQIATGGQAKFLEEHELEVDTAWVRMKLMCPEKLYEYFTRLPQERMEKRVFNKGNENFPPETEYCYLTDTYALSTFFRSMLWNQRRALLGYFGTVQRPVWLQLRALHDNYDFCSAYLQCVQDKGCVLGIVNFYTDGGDTHPNLDMVKDAAITAKDLRFRFEFGGHIGNITGIEKRKDTEFWTGLEKVEIGIRLVDASFGDSGVRMESGSDGEKLWVDIIFYEGTEKEIDLSGISRAYAAFVLEVRSKAESAGRKEVSAGCENGIIQVSLRGEKDIKVEAPVKPAPLREMLAYSKGYAGGAPY